MPCSIVRRTLLLAALVAIAAGAASAIERRTWGEEAAVPEQPIAEVLAAHTDRLLALPGVIGTAEAECDGAPCIAVLVARRTPALLRQIPAMLEGYRVDVRETGVIEALGEE